MTSPSLELQGNVIKRLRNLGVADGRVYDVPPVERVYPYVSYGPDQALSADAECLTSFEISIQLDVWSRAVGYVEARQIAEEVRSALDDWETEFADNALLSIEHTTTRVLRDPDGKTNHAIVEFLAIVEQP